MKLFKKIKKNIQEDKETAINALFSIFIIFIVIVPIIILSNIFTEYQNEANILNSISINDCNISCQSACQQYIQQNQTSLSKLTHH